MGGGKRHPALDGPPPPCENITSPHNLDVGSRNIKFPACKIEARLFQLIKALTWRVHWLVRPHRAELLSAGSDNVSGSWILAPRSGIDPD